MARVTDPREPIRLLIVDDDPMVRAGLVSMLGGTAELLIVGEAADGAAAIAAVAEHRPDVVLMDIAMRTMNGLEATEVLRKRAGAPEIIILTTFGSDEHLLRALRAGAAGFLLKDAPPPQIVDAVRRVAAGEPMLSGKVTRQLIDYVSGPGPHSAGAEARAALTGLTDREREVARAIAEGKTNAEIAAELFMSVPTVKTHISRLLTKLDLNNRVQVALLAHDAETR
ncbi:MAG TPA: response regulator transcription factor [Pseudonocardiaceae bacterium]